MLPEPVPLPAVVVGQTKPDGCDVPSGQVTLGVVGVYAVVGQTKPDGCDVPSGQVTLGVVGVYVVVGATGHAEVTGTEVPFQHDIIAGADAPAPVPEFCAQNCWPVPSVSTWWLASQLRAEAGAAMITAGTATSVVRPKIIAARAAIRRMVHLP